MELQRVFLDTDIGPDCDDTAALAILLQLCREQRAELLGVTHCTGSRYGLAAIDSICRLFGVQVPMGTCADRGFLDVETTYCYTPTLAEQFEHGFPPDAPQPDALDAMRRGLSGAEDQSVTLIAIGPLNNVARALSDPEVGALMRRKVARLVLMAGAFEADPVFTEWNVEMDVRCARSVVEGWPGELWMVPWEAMGDVLTGASLARAPENPVTVAYRLHTKGRMLRPSWDPATVAAALLELDPSLAWSAPGKVCMDENGVTRFLPAADGRHRYLRRVGSAEAAASWLEEMLSRAVQTMTEAILERKER